MLLFVEVQWNPKTEKVFSKDETKKWKTKKAETQKYSLLH